VLQDYSQAVDWYQKAALQGYVKAQYNLGGMYQRGEGVPLDNRQAVVWFRKAAEQGLANAQTNLGVAYSNGSGVPKNRVVAYALFALSAAKDPSGGNSATKNREMLAKEMTANEINVADSLMQEMSKPMNLLNVLDKYVNHGL
jgi:TPR repeat protein